MLVTEQPKEVRKIIKPVMQRNPFFAHPENILFNMIADETPHIRELAWRRIKKSHENNKPSMEVLEFKIPELSLDCKDFQNVISWQSVHVTEPPATKHIQYTYLIPS